MSDLKSWQALCPVELWGPEWCDPRFMAELGRGGAGADPEDEEGRVYEKARKQGPTSMGKQGTGLWGLRGI